MHGIVDSAASTGSFLTQLAAVTVAGQFQTLRNAGAFVAVDWSNKHGPPPFWVD